MTLSGASLVWDRPPQGPASRGPHRPGTRPAEPEPSHGSAQARVALGAVLRGWRCSPRGRASGRCDQPSHHTSTKRSASSAPPSTRGGAGPVLRGGRASRRSSPRRPACRAARVPPAGVPPAGVPAAGVPGTGLSAHVPMVKAGAPHAQPGRADQGVGRRGPREALAGGQGLPVERPFRRSPAPGRRRLRPTRWRPAGKSQRTTRAKPRGRPGRLLRPAGPVPPGTR